MTIKDCQMLETKVSDIFIKNMYFLIRIHSGVGQNVVLLFYMLNLECPEFQKAFWTGWLISTSERPSGQWFKSTPRYFLIFLLTLITHSIQFLDSRPKIGNTVISTVGALQHFCRRQKCVSY